MRYFLVVLFVWVSFAQADNVLTKANVKGDRLYLEFAHAVDPESFHTFRLLKPDSARYVLDLKQTRLGSKRVPLGLKHDGAKAIRISQFHTHTVRIVIEVSKKYRMIHGRKGARLYNITLPKTKKHKKSVSELFSKATSKNKLKPVHYEMSSKKEIKHTKATKPRIVVSRRRYTIILDPGHGGHDTGAIGAHKREKDIVLQIGKRLRRHLSKMGFRVIMTRSSDRFVRLRNRTRFANRKKGDVFVSIHANSTASRKKRYRHGVETFFLQTTRSARAKSVAARENSVVLRRSDKLSKNVILNSVMTGPKIVLSNKLAIDVQRHILGNLRIKYKGVADGGVRPAPFWVLVGAEMPAVLVETGYISNPTERKRLTNSRYQDLLAKGIAEGIANYLANREKEFE
jgi:N-acetylmuramoyl-L-alanine amidase